MVYAMRLPSGDAAGSNSSFCEVATGVPSDNGAAGFAAGAAGAGTGAAAGSAGIAGGAANAAGKASRANASLNANQS